MEASGGVTDRLPSRRLNEKRESGPTSWWHRAWSGERGGGLASRCMSTCMCRSPPAGVRAGAGGCNYGRPVGHALEDRVGLPLRQRPPNHIQRRTQPTPPSALRACTKTPRVHLLALCDGGSRTLTACLELASLPVECHLLAPAAQLERALRRVHVQASGLHLALLLARNKHRGASAQHLRNTPFATTYVEWEVGGLAWRDVAPWWCAVRR